MGIFLRITLFTVMANLDEWPFAFSRHGMQGLQIREGFQQALGGHLEQ
jgi:hypothetical protein